MTPNSSFDGIADAELVRRFNAGDADAFNEIVARHREMMFNVALKLLRNQADAEEVASDVFVRAHRGLKNFRGDSSLVTWLHRICQNLARNRYWYFWRRKRHVTLSIDAPLTHDSSETFSSVIACESAGPVQDAYYLELAGSIGRGLNQLTDPQREILTLWFVLDHSYDEIAQTLGINVGTVKSRIARARARLRSIVGDRHPEIAREEALST